MSHIGMKQSQGFDGKKTLLPLFLLLIGAPALAIGPATGDSDSDSDESIVFSKAIRLADCPDVKVLGAGGTRVISFAPRTFLGVETSNLTPELRAHFGVPTGAGVMLSKIVEDSPAGAAGLAVGDIVTRVDGDEITSASRLGRAVRQKDGGDAVEIEYWRDGEQYHTSALLTERERCSVDIGDSLRAISLEDLPEIGALGIEIGGEAIENTLETLRQTFADQDWDFKFEGLSEVEVERIEERMEHVQERLERLEERLERDFGREVERVEREIERDRARVERDRERSERERERADRARERSERSEDEQENGEGESI